MFLTPPLPTKPTSFSSIVVDLAHIHVNPRINHLSRPDGILGPGAIIHIALHSVHTVFFRLWYPDDMGVTKKRIVGQKFRRDVNWGLSGLVLFFAPFQPALEDLGEDREFTVFVSVYLTRSLSLSFRI